MRRAAVARKSVAPPGEEAAPPVSPRLAREDQNKDETCSNTYRLDTDGAFSALVVERLCEDVMVEQLENAEYDASCCRVLSQQLAARIMEALKSIGIKKHKLVAVVSIGSLKERAALQFGSRCLWNQTTDTFATVKFANKSLFAVAMVYGLYIE
ncbi:hypothetical protein CAPTEDRAFT_172635 [Capitella teleta]|uniref:Tctex1 domain-containing protein 1 n=1 Tax=Capitella teleta TaxID=283909 RepID=R7VBI7_CAPTE|nr:hypothetical protein CAPTEDRAFT_172635 [Capitella teleta]|eukprot:ELU16004.1 hypothetical protein CAPTEDRAFT_172635 [Capitella teleta]